MARVINFPQPSGRPLVAVQSSYSTEEIAGQFGIPESVIRNWVKEGRVEAENHPGSGLRFGFQALAIFRRVRELKKKGLSKRDIESEFQGQLDLFSKGGTLVELPSREGDFEKALRFFEHRDAAARPLFEKAVRSNDCAADALCNLGILDYEGRDASTAKQRLTEALSRDPAHVESHHNLGVIYHDEGKLATARAHYEAAVSLEPDFTHAIFALGVLLAEMGDFFGAVKRLDEFLVISEDVEKRTLARDLREKLVQLLDRPQWRAGK